MMWSARRFCFALLIIILHTPLIPGQAERTLRLELQGLETTQGELIIAFFSTAEAFESRVKPAYHKSIPVSELSAGEMPDSRVWFVDCRLAYGRYAVAAYQDLNGNGRLDKNLLGVPVEPYGFSGGGSYRWRPPGFTEAAFDFKKEGDVVAFPLLHW